MFTISQGVKPIFISTGEFINEFYGALTKDLYFWNAIPMVILATGILLPIGLVFVLLMSMLVFGYEFNFLFNLVQLRRPAQQPRALPVDDDDEQRRRLIRQHEAQQILDTVRAEATRLVSNNITLMISDISCAALQSHLIESSSDAANADLDLVPIQG